MPLLRRTDLRGGMLLFSSVQLEGVATSGWIERQHAVRLNSCCQTRRHDANADCTSLTSKQSRNLGMLSSDILDDKVSFNE